MNSEPSLNDMDDYNNNESPEKRRTIRLVIIGLLAVGVVYALFKVSFSDVDDYIGTEKKPGLNTAKTY